MKKLGVLEKIQSVHNNLRTSSMQGVFEDFPNVGEPFLIFGEGLEFGNRMIHTTPIKEILEIGKDGDSLDYIIFNTDNSKYKLTLLEEEVDSVSYLEESFTIPESTSESIN